MPRIIITEPGKTPQPYRLKIDRETTNIGRGSNNDILIEAGSASTNHCVMKRVPGGFTLEDLGSTNGIKLDDTRFAVIDLIDGAVVKIGDDVSLEYTLSEEEMETLGSEEFESSQRPMLPKSAPAKPPVEEESPEGVTLDDEEPQKTISEEDPWDDEEELEEKPKGKNTLFFILLAIIALALGFVLRHYQDVIMPSKGDSTEQAE